MQIVELGDCSMVIMKDSEDPPWVSVGNVYRYAEKCNTNIGVKKLFNNGNYTSYVSQISSDCIYTAGRLVLFFKGSIDENIHLHDKIELFIQ